MKSMRKVSAILFAAMMLISVLSGCTKEKNTSITTDNTTKKTVETTTAMTETNASLSLIAKAKVGDIVNFGRYEQDNNTVDGKEEIAWRVLAKQNGKVLLISEMILDSKPFNDKNEEITWETCTLRKWLNNEFLNNAFTLEEKNAINKTTLINKGFIGDNVPDGIDTQDKVFLLSFEETSTYFTNDSARIAKGTYYSKREGLSVFKKSPYVGNSFWGVRTLGGFYLKDYLVGIISIDGTNDKNTEGPSFNDVISADFGIRPAIWINI